MCSSPSSRTRSSRPTSRPASGQKGRGKRQAPCGNRGRRGPASNVALRRGGHGDVAEPREDQGNGGAHGGPRRHAAHWARQQTGGPAIAGARGRSRTLCKPPLRWLWRISLAMGPGGLLPRSNETLTCQNEYAVATPSHTAARDRQISSRSSRKMPVVRAREDVQTPCRCAEVGESGGRTLFCRIFSIKVQPGPYDPSHERSTRHEAPRSSFAFEFLLRFCT